MITNGSGLRKQPRHHHVGAAHLNPGTLREDFGAYGYKNNGVGRSLACVFGGSGRLNRTVLLVEALVGGGIAEVELVVYIFLSGDKGGLWQLLVVT